MWSLRCAEDGAKVPASGSEWLRTLCKLAGRQVWNHESGADADPADGGALAEAQEAARAEYVKRRREDGVKHSSDELLRLQCAGVDYKRVQRVRPPPLPSDADAAAPSASALDASLLGGAEFFELLQQNDGHWAGDYGGPMFLMPGLVIACTIASGGSAARLDAMLPPAHRAEMVRYLRNHQNEDGGYGLHIEGHSTMFGTVLSYVCLRLLGVDASDAQAAKARRWILSHGSATHVPSWGKFWLAVLGCFSWDGLNPIPPEVWLLPYTGWSGIGWMHPGRFWCHCRMVYLPMSYLYGDRVTGPITPTVRALRAELFACAYDGVDWNAARNQCAKEDLYYPHPMVQDVLWWTLYKAEALLLPGRWGVLRGLRRMALAEALKHIEYEDENTRYVCIGPVNKVMNMLCRWHAEKGAGAGAAGGDAVMRHAARLPDYLWVAEDGMKMQGYNGSQCWDTTFAVQALCATGMAQHSDAVRASLVRAGAYVEATQVREDSPGPNAGAGYYRHISKGAWPFSTRDHGWPISDCSSEGLKATLALERSTQEGGLGLGSHALVPLDRMDDCVRVILSYQNPTGGWATYENSRSFAALELINPAETFGDIVIDYDYVECSSACMTALAAYITRQRKQEGGWTSRHPSRTLERALGRGAAFIRSIQRPDGSWYGSWGVCFTYAAWFGCEGLSAAEAVLPGAGGGLAEGGPRRRAAAFLLTHQRPDGGWGESYLSCELKTYSQLPGDQPSHVVNTAWAMLALLNAGQAAVDARPLHRAARFLLSMQEPCGDWPQQHISGVFNRNCMITYANYRNIFPLWALGEYKAHCLDV